MLTQIKFLYKYFILPELTLFNLSNAFKISFDLKLSTYSKYNSISFPLITSVFRKSFYGVALKYYLYGRYANLNYSNYIPLF